MKRATSMRLSWGTLGLARSTSARVAAVAGLWSSSDPGSATISR
jgi:hypothetical protein